MSNQPDNEPATPLQYVEHLTIACEDGKHMNCGPRPAFRWNNLTTRESGIQVCPCRCHRDELGKAVRDLWVKWAKDHPSPKPNWLLPYEQLSESDKEADRQIGEGLLRRIVRALTSEPTTAGPASGDATYCPHGNLPPCIYCLKAENADLRQQVETLRAQVKEWLCEKCNTVYPGPPTEGFDCVLCPNCKGFCGPRQSVESRKLKEQVERLTAERDANERASQEAVTHITSMLNNRVRTLEAEREQAIAQAVSDHNTIIVRLMEEIEDCLDECPICGHTLSLGHSMECKAAAIRAQGKPVKEIRKARGADSAS